MAEDKIIHSYKGFSKIQDFFNRKFLIQPDKVAIVLWPEKTEKSVFGSKYPKTPQKIKKSRLGLIFDLSNIIGIFQGYAYELRFELGKVYFEDVHYPLSLVHSRTPC